MLFIEEDKYRPAQRIVVHLSGNDTTETIKAFAHVCSARVQVIAAGSRQVQHTLANKGFEIICTDWLMEQ